MKRTKPTKRERGRLKPPHINLGGHIPYPPKECPVMRIYDEDGIEYVDLSLCSHCKKCQRWKEFNDKWKEFWKEYKRIHNKYHPSQENSV